VRDGARVAELAGEGIAELLISPDGKWLMSSHNIPCRLWEVGTWREARRIDGYGLGFSSDGRLLVVQDPGKALRLVEAETGRTLAGLESPDLCGIRWATTSPDGSRLVVTTNEGPAVHVWDLRAIRRQLVDLGLDWDAPAYSEHDPADSSLPPLPPLRINLGPLAEQTEHLALFTESPQTLIERYTGRLEQDPQDAEAHHHRAHALIQLNRLPEGIDDLAQAIRLRPGDPHLLALRGRVHAALKQHEPAISDLEASLARKPDQPFVRETLALCCNNRAWELANGPDSRREWDRALALARRAVALAPQQQVSLNTLGVVQYRAGRYAEAIVTLEQSLAAGRGRFDAFDLFFLALAHHRMGHRAEARSCFDRGVLWLGEHRNLDARSAQELAAFRAEAEAVLAGPAGELPDDVFAP
jgi:tetratricopeptide (TPR) repeat protein